MDEEKRSLFRRFRRWAVIQKYTLQRGYVWGQVPAIGIIFASSIKAAFPGFINTFGKFITLVIISFVGLYFTGWIDRKFRFLHEENIYTTETNPLMMEIVNEARMNKLPNNDSKGLNSLTTTNNYNKNGSGN